MPKAKPKPARVIVKSEPIVSARFRIITCSKCQKVSQVLEGGLVTGFSLAGCEHFLILLRFIYKNRGKDIKLIRKDLKSITKPLPKRIKNLHPHKSPAKKY